MVLITVSFVRKYDKAARWKKNICYRQRRRKEIVYDDTALLAYLSTLHPEEGHIEDLKVDHHLQLRGIRTCAERASKPRVTNFDQISKTTTTTELLERRTLRFDTNASHIERRKGSQTSGRLREPLLSMRKVTEKTFETIV
ncbi:hypothetical protein RB195_022442 [Necator americanus]|uniref:Uncharacterized protein n=1 Tax=Necator americanus TaxID=51031 RepID=A0ABR1EFH9_NECAM